MAKTATAPGKSLTKSEVATHLAEKAGISKKQAQAVIQAQAELAYKQARNTFVIPGIGKLVLAKSAPRVDERGHRRAKVKYLSDRLLGRHGQREVPPLA